MHFASCSLVEANDCDDFPDTVIIGLRIEMSVVIFNALYKYRLLLLLLLLLLRTFGIEKE